MSLLCKIFIIIFLELYCLNIDNPWFYQAKYKNIKILKFVRNSFLATFSKFLMFKPAGKG